MPSITAKRIVPGNTMTRAQSIRHDLKVNAAQIKKVKADIESHKKIMRQSRYTAEGYKAAVAKLHKLEAKLQKLLKLHAQLERMTRM